jgi:hypothetical protein
MNSVRRQLTQLVGGQVGVALVDGSRIDDCQLVSLSRSRGVGTAWVFHGGDDLFVPVDAISDVWEVSRAVRQPLRQAA